MSSMAERASSSTTRGTTRPNCLAPSGHCGVPFSVVLDACQILANNRDGTLRVRGVDADLCAPDGERYAVCTSFRAWTPPKVLPAHWDLPAMGTNAAHPASSASTYSAVVKTADDRCAVTGAVSRLEATHLVPEAEAPWWTLRGMNALTNNLTGINSPANCLALRADLSGLGMAEGDFVFAPYAGAAVCVCLTNALPDFAAEYHLRAVCMPRRIHPLNVYVRFAWGVFRKLRIVLHELAWHRDVAIVEEPDLSDGMPTDGRKRKRTQDEDEGRLLSDGDDDESPQGSSDAAAREPPFDLYNWTERDLEMAERLDAGLHGRPLAPYEEAADMYPGYSKAMRLQHEYRMQHPEVSAVRSARVARMGEEDDEQQL
ncbi:hypothetical protein B0H13DRAFT_245291 [Mycena leptocephala]|nr:hypothetical protein B0H13DRAFT_245291 [Mycena leptocephala]